MEDASPAATDLAAGFLHSPYFNARAATSMAEARRLIAAREVSGVIHLQSDFARGLSQARGRAQIIVLGIDANTARIIQNYSQGVIQQWMARRAAEGHPLPVGASATVQSRLWFNEANDSHYFLVPGLIVLIMTQIGALLTALVMAREWERGTLEAIFVTPVRSGEILLSKMIPYFLLGMIGLALCILSAKFLFHVPFRGSIAILVVVSVLYLLVALAIGLLVSSITKNQFLSSIITLLISLLPALFLSGFLFDLRSEPFGIQVVSYVLPARYYVALLQTLFLAGDIWSVILSNAVVLAFMALVLIGATRAVLKKRLV
jgi:ABC-2 type transport system permease protein